MDVGIGGGVESMSMFDMMAVLNPDKVPRLVIAILSERARDIARTFFETRGVQFVQLRC